MPFTAATGDETLSPDKAIDILGEILEAQNQSRYLGLTLNIPDYEVTSIHKQYTDPKDCLYYVLVKFLNGIDPIPTWKVIIAALRSPAVNLPQLAMKLETKHIRATRNVLPETITNTGRCSHLVHELFLCKKAANLVINM